MTNGTNDWGVSFSRITFTEKVLQGHPNVIRFSREKDILFTITRESPDDELRLLCCDEYVFGTTLLDRALAEFGTVNLIYVGGVWNGYTKEAKEQCLRSKIGGDPRWVVAAQLLGLRSKS